MTLGLRTGSPPPLNEDLPEFPSLGETMVRVIPESVLSYGGLALLLVQLTISEESMRRVSLYVPRGE